MFTLQSLLELKEGLQKKEIPPALDEIFTFSKHPVLKHHLLAKVPVGQIMISISMPIDGAPEFLPYKEGKAIHLPEINNEYEGAVLPYKPDSLSEAIDFMIACAGHAENLDVGRSGRGIS